MVLVFLLLCIAIGSYERNMGKYNKEPRLALSSFILSFFVSEISEEN